MNRTRLLNLKLLIVLVVIMIGIVILFNSSVTKTPVGEHARNERIGVFGLKSDRVGENLGVAWTRLPLLWKDWENNSAKFKIQQNNLVATKTLYTIRAVNSNKTTCYNLTSLIDQHRNQLPPDVITDPSNFVSCTPTSIDDYRQFVRDIATKYSDSVQAWQIENEVYGFQPQYWSGDPTFGEIDNYLAMLRVAYSEIKAVNPDLPVVSAGIALGDRTDFDDLGYIIPIGDANLMAKFNQVESNVKKLLSPANCSSFDVVDLHLYHTLDSIPNRVAWLKRLMQESGCVKPIWTTETAGPDPNDPANNLQNTTLSNWLQLNAQDIPSRFSIMFNAGIEKVFYYSYQDNAGSKLGVISGLVDKSYHQKPAYTALKKYSVLDK